MPIHIPVLVREVLDGFKSVETKGLIVDCTLGMGGHSKALLKKGYNVIGIDRDENAIDKAKENLKDFKNIRFVHDNFINLRKILNKLKVKKVSGILVDLGVSSYQLEDESRGFGFTGKLDMRMDSSQELTAEKVVNEYSEDKLKKVLFDYGEKSFAGSIAKKIVENRKKKRIESAEELFEIVKNCMPGKYRYSREHHWATPTFRALRIEVNNDIENISNFEFLDCLEDGGILEVISFHSIEDDIVKNKFIQLEKEDKIEILTKEAISASPEEIKFNVKALRAKLRIVKRL